MPKRVLDMLIGGFTMILIFAAYKYVFVDRFNVPVISAIVEKA